MNHAFGLLSLFAGAIYAGGYPFYLQSAAGKWIATMYNIHMSTRLL